jgi:hypothetical protein
MDVGLDGMEVGQDDGHGEVTTRSKRATRLKMKTATRRIATGMRPCGIHNMVVTITWNWHKHQKNEIEV